MGLFDKVGAMVSHSPSVGSGLVERVIRLGGGGASGSGFRLTAGNARSSSSLLSNCIMYTQGEWSECICLAVVILYSVFSRLVKFSFCAKNMDFRQFNFRLLRAHMHHTPTHACWSCGKIFVLSSKRTKRTNFRTDKKNRYTVAKGKLLVEELISGPYSTTLSM